MRLTRRLFTLLLALSLLLSLAAFPASAEDEEFMPVERAGRARCTSCQVPTGPDLDEFVLPCEQTTVTRCKNSGVTHTHATLALYAQFKCINPLCPGYTASEGGYYFYHFEFYTGFSSCPYGPL